MEVMVPQYVVSKGYTQAADDKRVYAQLLSSSLGTDPTTGGWSVSTSYSAGQEVYFLDTSGITNGCWCKYEALQSSTGKVPIDEPAYWINLGAIQAYKMFDQYSNTKSLSSTADITVTIFCRSITDIAFLNVQAKKITINAWNCLPSSTYPYVANCSSGNKIIDNMERDLTQPVNNWYEYFFQDFDYLRSLSAPTGITIYHNVIVEITFTKYDDADCYVGILILGRKYRLGALRYGVSTGIEDYSKKIFDETFGSHYIQEGNYRKLMNCDLYIKNIYVNMVNSILTQLRARPTVWQGNSEATTYDNLIVYGIAKSFNIIIQGPTMSECNLEIEGLI